MTREASRGETKYVKEASYEGETEFDEVVGKFIKRRKSYNIYFQLRVFLSYKDMK